MGINKVQYGNTTLIDLTGTTATADKILTGYGAFGRDGVWMNGTAQEGGDVPVWQGSDDYVYFSDEVSPPYEIVMVDGYVLIDLPPAVLNLQTKTRTYTPTTSQQTDVITADVGYDGLEQVNITINAIPYPDGDNEAYGSAGILGTWYFNSTLNITTAFSYSVTFTPQNESSYYQIGSRIYGTTIKLLVYGDGATVYDSEQGGWQYPQYRTITITGGTDVNDPDFIAWLEANATKQ